MKQLEFNFNDNIYNIIVNITIKYCNIYKRYFFEEEYEIKYNIIKNMDIIYFRSIGCEIAIEYYDYVINNGEGRYKLTLKYEILGIDNNFIYDKMEFIKFIKIGV